MRGASTVWRWIGTLIGDDFVPLRPVPGVAATRDEADYKEHREMRIDRYSLERELAKRMRGPQRHRLLQGYPVPALMRVYDRVRADDFIDTDPDRPLLVGILPHAACNPSVQGCGYCTFPHEEFRLSEVRETVLAVRQELQSAPCRMRKVSAVYFGGGTANLTPPDLFSELCRTVWNYFQIKGAEVTLEGAPVYFTTRKAAMLEVMLRDLEGTDLRVSMGVQTYDSARIAQMGRQHIGGPEAVEQAVKAARSRGMTTSADLMINMPGQTLAEMKADVQRTSDLGFSQLCLYHLVLFRGLDIPWAKDADKLARLPDNERAFSNWLAVRDLAQSLGYRQTTLTNFEREGQFRYEDGSYRPELYDWAGFGPEALSCYSDMMAMYAVKWMNESSGADYRQAMGQGGDARRRYFIYDDIDMRLLFLTRTFARLEVSRETYKRLFRSDVMADFAEPLAALSAAGLVIANEALLRLTDRGIFFADSVAGLLAYERISQIRQGEVLEHAPILRMG